MEMKKFNDAELIDLVRQFTCLWDIRSAGFKNKNLKENAWISISEVMSVSIPICQSRWLALRQRYTKEKRAFLHMPSGSGADTVCTWPLLEQLRFLDLVIKQRKTAGNIVSKVNINSPIMSPEDSSSHSMWDAMSELIYPDPQPICDSQDETEPESEHVNSVEHPPSTSAEPEVSGTFLKEKSMATKRKLQQLREETPKKMRMKKNESTAQSTDILSKTIVTAFERLENFAQPASEPTAPELTNVNYSFGRTIALMLEELEPQKQMMMRQKIMKLWAEANF